MIHKTTSKAILVGTFCGPRETGSTGREQSATWSNLVIAEQAGLDTDVIGADGATKFYGVPPPANPGHGSNDRGSTSQCCPSAISVQIMGNKSLNAAEGQLAAGVVPANMDLRASSRKWSDISGEFISYFRPRLLSGAKLALRGVQMNSHPLNMSDCSDFRNMFYSQNSSEGHPWVITNIATEGWAPMFIANPDESDVTLLVTVEWRVRFSIGHPAVSSHTHHGVSSDRTWDDHVRAAVKVLPGVIDIVESVAQRGIAAAHAYAALGA